MCGRAGGRDAGAGRGGKKGRGWSNLGTDFTRQPEYCRESGPMNARVWQLNWVDKKAFGNIVFCYKNEE